MNRRPALLAFALACIVVTSASCSSGGQTTQTTVAQVRQSAPAPVISATTVLINGKTVAVPREEYSPGRPINSVSDDGQQIIISSKGVLPQRLMAPTPPVAITWTNLTTAPVALRYVAFGTPGQTTIAAGSSFTFPTNTGSGSISYVTSTGYHGTAAIDVLPLPDIPQTTTTSPTG